MADHSERSRVPALQIPYAHGTVAAGRRHSLSPTADGHTPNRPGVARQRSNLARDGIEQANRAVFTPNHQPSAVGVIGQAVPAHCIESERERLGLNDPAGRAIAQRQLTTGTEQGEAPAIGAKCQSDFRVGGPTSTLRDWERQEGKMA